jgi:hypothetical protein
MGRLFLLRRPSYDDPEYWRKGAQKLRDAQLGDGEKSRSASHQARSRRGLAQ